MEKGTHAKAGNEVAQDETGVSAQAVPGQPGDPWDGEGTLSGCPGGSVDGGVCRPYNNVSRSTWMSTYTGAYDLRIADAILPGTHNSGADKEAPYSNNNATCQDVSPLKQLTSGIRVLDLRVRHFSGGSGSKRFIIVHNFETGRTVQEDVLGAVLAFRAQSASSGSAKKEMLILDFHGFEEFNDAAHEELARIINSTLGDIIIPPWMHQLTIGQLWETSNFGVVIAYARAPRDPLFWNGVTQRWSGQNVMTTDQLKSFMDEVAGETKPYAELRSIQCAKYTVLFTPDDFSDKIRQWFWSENARSYIQNFFIINTDWSLRQRLVDNCIHACDQKVRSLKQCIAFNTSAQNVVLANGYRAMTARLTDAHVAHMIHLPSAPDEGDSVTISNQANYIAEVSTVMTDFPADSVLLDGKDVVSFVYHGGSKQWKVVAPAYIADQGQGQVPTPKAYDKLLRFQLSDGNWAERLFMPVIAKRHSVIHITSSAALASVIDGKNMLDGRDLPITRGFDEAFIFDESRETWSPLDVGTDTGFAAPTNFRLIDNTWQPVKLTWDVTPRAVQYRVYRFFTQIEETTGTGFEREIRGYGRYHVRAVDVAGNVSERTPYVFFYDFHD